MACLGPQASNAESVKKPYKVCPKEVTAKDTPCRVAGPEAVIVQRVEREDPRDKEIIELKERIKLLEEIKARLIELCTKENSQ